MNTPETPADPIVILGTGLAGYTLAREFRKLDKTTPLTLISADHGGFYSKPMLSNALTSGKQAETLIMKRAEQMAAELGASILPMTQVTHLDAVAKRLTLSQGAPLSYRSLVLATGADPIRLPLAGDAADQVCSVNNVEDFSRFSQALDHAATITGRAPRVVILGGGLIGCEFANDLLARDIQATVIDPGAWPLGRLLPEAAGAYFRARLERAGVSFRFGTSVTAVQRETDHTFHLDLANGETLSAEVILSAVGLRPRVSLAQSAGARIGRGIRVDRYLQSSLPHIYALGDVAEVCGEGAFSDTGPGGLLLPFVLPIMQQARALAVTLSGTPTAVSYPAMPVVVKTPACPTVVSPPSPATPGQWILAETPDGLRATYEDQEGHLLGFALMGAAVSEKQKLTGMLPATLV